jgi:hypothetical protein
MCVLTLLQGCTPLMSAVEMGVSESVTTLLECGASVYATDKHWVRASATTW